MAMFGKSRQIVRRAWRRLIDSFRRNLGSIRLYHIPLDFGAGVQRLEMDSPTAIFETPLLMDIAVLGAGTLSVETCNLPTRFDPPVLAETPPSRMEAIVHEQTLAMDTAAVDSEIARLAEPALRAFTHWLPGTVTMMSINPRRFDARIKQLRLAASGAAVLDGLHAVSDLPIVRSSLPFFHLPPDVRMGYWRELVDQVRKQPKDLELIGVFPNVPLKGIRRATIDAVRGELKVWCEPVSGRRVAGALIVARDRESGEVHRVFDRRTIPYEGL